MVAEMADVGYAGELVLVMAAALARVVVPALVTGHPDRGARDGSPGVN